MKVDPATLGIIGPSLIAIAQEMSTVLTRSAYSAIVREAKDSSSCILNPEGKVVAQSEYIPIFVNAFSHVYHATTKEFPVEELKPGDLLLTNDPYNGGQHLADIIMLAPVFHEDEIVAFSGCVAHHLDIGGTSPGHNPLAVDIYQDGIVIPPLKVRLDTFEDSSFVRILCANIRMPDYTMGDLGAQLAALATSDRRLMELAAKYGIEVVQVCMEEIMNISEAKTRARIREIPDGTYCGEDVIDGLNNDTLAICVAVTVQDDEIMVDFEGTAPQCNEAPLNSSLGGTVSAVHSYFKSILTGTEVPGNNGCNRPIHIHVPKGSLLNPYRPASIGIRMQPVCRSTDAIAKALSQAVPELVTAPGNNSCLSVRFNQRSLDKGTYHVFAETQGGCFGAGDGYDGEDAVAIPLTNVSNVPIEHLESENRFIRIRRYELNRGSAGHGQYRGGMGITRTYEILEPGVTFVGESDRHYSQPWGLAGGSPGGKGSFRIERNGEIIELRPRGVFPLQVDDLLTLTTGGGGGYGDPMKRDHEALRREVEQGLLSIEEAIEMYGFDPSEVE